MINFQERAMNAATSYIERLNYTVVDKDDACMCIVALDGNVRIIVQVSAKVSKEIPDIDETIPSNPAYEISDRARDLANIVNAKRIDSIYLYIIGEDRALLRYSKDLDINVNE